MKKMFLTFVAALTLFGAFFTPNFAFAAEEGTPCTCSDGRPGVVVADTSILSGCDCSGNRGGAIIEILYTVIDWYWRFGRIRYYDSWRSIFDCGW